MSNYQPKDLRLLIQQTGAQHVVVRMGLPWEQDGLKQWSIAQVKSARQNGCSVGAYAWAYRSASPVKTVREGLGLAHLTMGGDPPILWIDCERYLLPGQPGFDPGPNAAWLRAAHAECEKQGVQMGIYTGRWWLDQYLPEYFEFTQLALWLADYDGRPDLDRVTLPPGWPRERLLAHQFTDTPCDQSVFRLEAVS